MNRKRVTRLISLLTVVFVGIFSIALPSGLRAESPYSAEHQEMLEGQKQLQKELALLMRVAEMKQERGITSHDQTSLRECQQHILDKSIPLFQETTLVLQQQKEEQEKTIAYQLHKQLQDTLQKQTAGAKPYQDSLETHINARAYMTGLAKTELEIQLDQQKDLLRIHKEKLSAIVEAQNEQGLSMAKWPAGVYREYEQESKALDSSIQEASAIKDNLTVVEQAEKRQELALKSLEVLKKGKAYCDTYEANLKAHGDAIDADTNGFERARALAAVPLEATRDVLEGAKLLNDFRLDHLGKQKEKSLIFDTIQEAQANGRLDVGSLTPLQKEALYEKQEDILAAEEFSNSLGSGLEIFSKGYAAAEVVGQKIERIQGVIAEGRKVRNNAYVPRSTENAALYFETVGSALEDAGDALGADYQGSVLGASLKTAGLTLRSVNTAIQAGAAYEELTGQGTTGDLDEDGRPTRFKDQSGGAVLHLDHELGQRYQITVRQKWESDDNVETNQWYVDDPGGRPVPVPAELVPKLSRALSRLESIKGAPVTQEDVCELVRGELEIREFSDDNDFFEIDPETLGRHDVLVDVDSLYGTWGQQQECLAGRYYTRCDYFDQAMQGVPTFQTAEGTFKSFETLSEKEQTELIRWANRINQMSALSGRSEDVPHVVLSKIMIEKQQLTDRQKNIFTRIHETATGDLAESDPDYQSPKPGSFGPTHKLFIHDLLLKLKDPNTPAETRELIAALLDKEKDLMGVDEINGLHNPASPDALDTSLAGMSEEDIDTILEFLAVAEEANLIGGIEGSEMVEDSGGFSETGQEGGESSSAVGLLPLFDPYADINDPETLAAMHDAVVATRRNAGRGSVSEKVTRYVNMLQERQARQSAPDREELAGLLQEMGQQLSDLARQQQERRNQAERADLPDPLAGTQDLYKGYYGWLQDQDPNSYRNIASGQTVSHNGSIVLLDRLATGGSMTDYSGYDSGSGFSGDGLNLLDVPVTQDDSFSSGGSNPMGLPNPKTWYVYQVRKPSGQQVHRIGRIDAAANSNEPHHLVYGPNTFVACENWLTEQGYW